MKLLSDLPSVYREIHLSSQKHTTLVTFTLLPHKSIKSLYICFRITLFFRSRWDEYRPIEIMSNKMWREYCKYDSQVRNYFTILHLQLPGRIGACVRREWVNGGARSIIDSVKYWVGIMMNVSIDILIWRDRSELPVSEFCIRLITRYVLLNAHINAGKCMSIAFGEDRLWCAVCVINLRLFAIESKYGLIRWV